MEFNEKQLAIISTAEKLFSVTGFNGTSVRDIAKAANVNVAMISYYFGSKEKLMEAVFEQKTNNMRLKIENLIQNKEMTSLEKVFVLIDDYVAKFMSQQYFHKVMLLEQLSNNTGDVARLIHELKVRNQASIKKLIREGQKSGEFKKSIDDVFLMATIVGTVSQMIISEFFYREVNGLEHLSDEEYREVTGKKLRTHLKSIFKAILINETNVK